MSQSMKRRHFLQVAGMTSMGCLFPAISLGHSLPVKNPNVLFVSVDDLNNWIEPLGGHPQAKTPNLLQFARKSVTFKNAYCASPSCNPSRTALLTGKHPHITGLYSNPQIWRHVLPDEITLPEYFRKSGYWTAGSGKIFHNNMPDPRSWDTYFPSKIRHMPEYYLPDIDPGSKAIRFHKMDNEIREDDPRGLTFKMPPFKGMYIAFDFEPLPYNREETGDFSAVNWVAEQLQRKHTKPFFLACGLYRPHLPWYVPQIYYDRFPLKEIKLPDIFPEDWDDLPETAQNIAARGRYHQYVIKAGLWKHAVRGYLASIYYADDLFGQLIQALHESEYANNTIVVVFSDHGWQLGEKKHWRKFALWQNVINSVLMIRVPNGIQSLPNGTPSGTVCTQNVSLVDVFPTLTDLCGLTPKNGVTGKSLLPLLKNPAAKRTHPVITAYTDKHYSVVKDNWHYIQYDGGEEELYNLDRDKEEWTNLAANPAYNDTKIHLRSMIPENRKKFVKTDPIRWADVLNGTIVFE